MLSFDIRTVPEDRNIKLGGCATIAGWGKRYSDFMDFHSKFGTRLRQNIKCRTDFSSFTPDKIQ